MNIESVKFPMTDLGNNKLSSKKTDGRKNTVGNKWKGSNRINYSINISHPFKKMQPSTISIPNWAMSAQQNLNRSQSPPKNLIQTIRKIDRSRTLECWSSWHTVDRFPTSGMHLKSS